jgi:hypothetical protein
MPLTPALGSGLGLAGLALAGVAFEAGRRRSKGG